MVQSFLLLLYKYTKIEGHRWVSNFYSTLVEKSTLLDFKPGKPYPDWQMCCDLDLTQRSTYLTTQRMVSGGNTHNKTNHI